MSADVLAEMRAEYIAEERAERQRRTRPAADIRADLARHGLPEDAPVADWPDETIQRALALVAGGAVAS